MFLKLAVVIVSTIILGMPAGVGKSPADEAMASAVSSGSGAQRRDSPFAVGDLFPDLAFPALEDGTPTRLSDFRGRKVMLHVFASW